MDLEVLDINTDGNLDLIVTTYDDYIRFYRIKGKKLIEYYSYQFPMSIIKILIRDVDSDGKYDIIVGTRDKMIRIFQFTNNMLVEKSSYKFRDSINNIAIGDVFNKLTNNIVVSAGKYIYILSFENGIIKEEDNIIEPEAINQIGVAYLDNYRTSNIIYSNKDKKVYMMNYKSRFFHESSIILQTDGRIEKLILFDINSDDIQELMLVNNDSTFNIFKYVDGSFFHYYRNILKGRINAIEFLQIPSSDNSLIFIAGKLNKIIFLVSDTKSTQSFEKPLELIVNSLKVYEDMEKNKNMLYVGCESGEILIYEIN